MCCFSKFGHWAERFGVSAQNIGMVNTTEFYFSTGIFWGQIYEKLYDFFPDLSRKLSNFRLKHWGKSVGTPLFLSGGIILGKPDFLRKNYFHCFPLLGWNSLDFREKASASLSKVHFTSPERHFGDKIEYFLVSFLVLSGSFSNFWLKPLGNSVGTASNEPRGITWRKHYCRRKEFFVCFWRLSEKLLDFRQKNIGMAVGTDF